MSASTERVARALAHQTPDHTPLFEIYSPYHPIYWDICGRTPATAADRRESIGRRTSRRTSGSKR